ncbi:helix-turn-helix transcriptional regulator [Seleniivibrio woodruffii]|uniref:ArsR/SmtB family transcription factor n=1 Tax=Seleniivibrio woodruffii TaxID=1078050 RepID=UPI0026EC8BD7|nr:metalloregulator ArsR/SmtB family transcription factor [Seleniivibrio woodruffii]
MSDSVKFARIFKALGNKTRLAIILKILKTPYVCSADMSPENTDIISQATCVGTIASEFNYSLPTISRHLKELRDSGLIRMYKSGNRIIVEPDMDALRSVKEFIISL